MFDAQMKIQKLNFVLETNANNQDMTLTDPRLISSPVKNFPRQSEQLPETLIGDQIRLKQVLINLTRNAMKFTNKGEIRIVMSYDEIGEMLEVQVADTGSGLEPKELSKLFEMYSKVERTENFNEEGTGIGLAICKKIVECSGGQMHVYSEGLNHGSMFTFTMKMKKLDTTQAKPMDSNLSDSARSESSMSLMNLSEPSGRKPGRARSEIIENDIEEIEQIHN